MGENRKSNKKRNQKVLNSLLLILCVIVCARSAQIEDDYYKVLEVERSATLPQIKSAFRSMSRKFHPDVNPAADANDRYAAISEAYEVLANAEKRQKYDRFGKEGLKPEHNRGGGFGGDPFDFFFGGGARAEPEEQKGEALIIKLSVSLQDLYRGRELSVTLNKRTICSHCRGSGAERPDDVAKCDACDGRGIFIRRVQVAPGFVQQTQGVCPKCNGKGKVVKSTCHLCGGGKLLPDLEVFRISIEKGAPDQHKIFLHNSGGDFVDKLSSDLIFELHELPHPMFKRIDLHHLQIEVRLSLKEALLGFRKRLKHLDGHFVSLNCEGVTQPNEKRIIRGEGMPKHDYPADRGDLFVVFKVELPEEFEDKQKKLWGDFFNA